MKTVYETGRSAELSWLGRENEAGKRLDEIGSLQMGRKKQSERFEQEKGI
jgi:hypothetical protein